MRKKDFKKPGFSLDRSRRGDLACQVAAGLRTAISTGFYQTGEIIPPVRDLAEILEVSKGIAEQAVAKLREEGLISPRPAVGSVVCAPDRPLWKGQVLIIVPPGGTQHYMNVICATVRDALIAAGYLALTVTVSRIDDGRYDFSLLDLMMRQHTDLIVQLHDQPEVAKWLSTRKIPFVRFTTDNASRLPLGCMGAVSKSSEQGVAEFATHCRDVGVRDVLVATAWGEEMHVADALHEVGVKADVWNLTMPSGTPGTQVSQYALQAMTSWLAEKSYLPELIFFDDDYLASGAITALLYAGVHIPSDVRIAVLANRVGGSGLAFPVPLTRIEFDSVADGCVVATAVLKCLKSGTFPSGIAVGPKYIRGETF